MGFLDRFGKRAEMQVGVDRAACRPGETVTATITVHAKRDFEIEEGRAELVYENEYRYRTRVHTSKGGSSTQTRTDTQKIVHATQQFHEGGSLPSGTSNQYTVSFRLPEDAIPTCDGEITKVRWRVEAILGVERSLDPDQHAPFAVLSARDLYADLAQRAPDVDNHGDCELDLRLQGGRHVRPGDTLRGTLVVAPHEELDPKEIRIELVRHEHVPRDQGNTESKVEAKAVLGGGSALTARIPREFPFELVVPEGASPCVQTDNSTLRWLLRGVVARRMRSDYNISVDLNVYTAPGGGTPSDATAGSGEEAATVWSSDEPLSVFREKPGSASEE